VKALLARHPDRRKNWSLLFRRVRRLGSAQPRADRFRGRPEQETDADICLMRGETLLAGGHDAEGRRFLRAASRLSTTRRQLGDTIARAAAKDAEFIELVTQADQARDAGQWADGARYYAEALALYPAHCGYLVQYAHCLKEQEKFAAAEIHYRSALALGAAVGDVCEHLDFVATRQGGSPGENPPTARQEAGMMMDAPPTRDDIELVFTLLTGSGALDTAEVLHILRTQKTIRDVFVWVIRQERFRTRNRELLSLVAAGALAMAAAADR
jgi:tetratricopeptide (TPR) repeat protein